MPDSEPAQISQFAAQSFIRLRGTDVEKALASAGCVLPADNVLYTSPNSPGDPAHLSRDQLVTIATRVQQLLYLDDRNDPPKWDLDKEWSSCDVCCELAAVLGHYELLPPEGDDT